MKTLFTALLLILACAGMPSIAHAQIDFNFDGSQDDEDKKFINPYDDKYKPNIDIDQSGNTKLISNYDYTVKFIRKPNADPDDLNLVISSHTSLTGCLDVEQPTLKIVNASPLLRLEIVEGAVAVDHETVRYFHYECRPTSGGAQINLTLNKSQLIEDRIENIAVTSGQTGAFAEINVEFLEERTVLIIKNRDLTRIGLPPAPDSSGLISQWNYPENTIVLFAPSADLDDPKTMEAARVLARKKGLTPMDEVLNGFAPNPGNTNKLYVVDTTGRFNDKLEKDNDTFTLGKIHETELYFGANGPYDKPIEKDVFAKRPGIYE